MYRGHQLAVVMPAYNVQEHIARAVVDVPDFVDLLVVVDDASTDRTPTVLRQLSRPGVVVLRHDENRGVGAAICSGYAHALERGTQLLAVMAGDGQMDARDLPGLLDPLVEGRADYVKGNRFLHPDVWRAMPRTRLAGNIALSLLTKITSGYYRCFDSQCGYTAITAQALRALRGRMFPRYGYPNDLLARLRGVEARVIDVSVRPIYEGQPSGIRPWTVLHPIPWVLARSLLRRLWVQHVLGLVHRAPRLGDSGLARDDGPASDTADRIDSLRGPAAARAVGASASARSASSAPDALVPPIDGSWQDSGQPDPDRGSRSVESSL